MFCIKMHMRVLYMYEYSLLMKLPGDYFGVKQSIADQKWVMAYVSKKIAEHERTLDPDNPRDYIDAFLIEMRKENTASFSAKPRYFTRFLSFLLDSLIFSLDLMYLCCSYTEADQKVPRRII